MRAWPGGIGGIATELVAGGIGGITTELAVSG
jgi:hypothetical protein